jgi:ParB family chromosome partitioning protein
MAERRSRGGLGKSYFDIFEDNEAVAVKGGPAEMIRLSDIEPRKDQPRKTFDKESLEQLADSISRFGVLQPIAVRKNANVPGMYEIIAGERRWRAAKLAGLTEIVAVVIDSDELKAAQLSIIENVQREDLNPVEEAMAYAALINNFGLKQDEVAAQVGKSRPAVANMLRLLDLPDEVLTMLKEDKITNGHARALLAADDEKTIDELAEKIVKTGMSVREVERAVKPKKEVTKPATANFQLEKDVLFCKEVETALTTELGRRVSVKPTENGGTITIEFFSQQDLGDIAKKLCK